MGGFRHVLMAGQTGHLIQTTFVKISKKHVTVFF